MALIHIKKLWHLALVFSILYTAGAMISLIVYPIVGEKKKKDAFDNTFELWFGGTNFVLKIALIWVVYFSIMILFRSKLYMMEKVRDVTAVSKKFPFSLLKSIL
jgi:hypothetical protein